ncbi:nitroreductase/quinone reductase family protein [Branchiibius cervicis]|uniref:Nitroreductase/quinone reductase family protein n=1 Tax=Branchiibius cervicis TaxID=908252 RepID=A0ABW2ANG1_9MICO
MTSTVIEQNGFERLFNRLMSWLARHGLGPMGMQQLIVRGRSSGQERTAAVNPLPLDGELYLVAARGETQWVRNARAVGTVVLRKRSRRSAYVIEQVYGDDAVPVLRAYLKKWGFEVKSFFDGVGPDASVAELAAAAKAHPVFRLTPADLPQ